ncbi:hypothetical protein Poli38472_000677 [Pythium oligandrum]|uniref:ATP-dependent helicase CHD1-2/hrp3 HTH domain-containing protein n=1 Tax=Pythium oligandrum TaxID=41045 RepID=A0A8K1CD66_PYTOL|nr:hypothetical protein Poli38472_000677 [Pythium oligandrum]|eukprot:TMW60635.1 hypothetical protein Poli38472_000677 [Pythium oligandrum]
MSDNEETMSNGVQSTHEEDGADAKREDQSSSDDDSSSSSSGSSSSSDSSDSDDSDNEGDDKEQRATSDAGSQGSSQYMDRKYSIESLTSGATPPLGASNGLGHRSDAREKALAEPLNVNSTLAVSRFREKAQDDNGFLALGTKKRDRRTIEEIQRDIQKKRGKTGTTSSLTSTKKPLSGGIPAARPSPPRSSPVLSPESGVEMEKISLGLPMNKAGLKGKATNSARSRLEKKLLGRGGGGARTTTAAPAKGKKPTTTTTPGTGMVTNISAGKIIKPGTSSSSDHDSSSLPDTKLALEPKIEPKIVDGTQKPDVRALRALLRAVSRFGDLTDVSLYPGDHHKSFADEYKQSNFIIRSNVDSSLKMSEDSLHKLAVEMGACLQRSIEDDRDTAKFYELELKPGLVIERLYDNLKLRVAVQRALQDAGISPTKGPGAVYNLASKQVDTTVLGIGRDFPAWTWAEKDYDWNSKKDAALLLGIFVHGFGAWEDILGDDRLYLQKQRALKGERLKKRTENLLKRLPPPDNNPPRFISRITSLNPAVQNGKPSLDAIKSIASGAPVINGEIQNVQRQAPGSGSAPRTNEDSIRKSHTQLGGSGSSERPESVRKSSIAGSRDDEPSRDRSAPVKRSASDDNERRNGGDKQTSPRKKTKHKSSRSESKVSETPTRTGGTKRRMSADEILEKWKPNKKLKEIRQVLKKMQVMAEWSKDQHDEVVVDKVYKYVTTIGSAIDRIVVESEKKGSPKARDWDELCTALWTYAAGHTPFEPQMFERLYDDICADGDRLRQEVGRRTATTSS